MQNFSVVSILLLLASVGVSALLSARIAHFVGTRRGWNSYERGLLMAAGAICSVIVVYNFGYAAIASGGTLYALSTLVGGVAVTAFGWTYIIVGTRLVEQTLRGINNRLRIRA
jgi:hypothetical protein